MSEYAKGIPERFADPVVQIIDHARRNQTPYRQNGSGHLNGHLNGVDRSTLIHLEEARFFEDHPGFIPRTYNPGQLGEWLSATADYAANGNHHEDEVFINTADSTIRPRYDGVGPKEMAPVREALARVGVYNSPIGSDGQRYNVNILKPEASVVQARTREVLKQRFVTLLPFANEPNTIDPAIRYASGRVGSDKVLAVDAGLDPIASARARNTGERVVNQKDILECVDWNKLVEEGVLPQRFPKKGAKGLTLYAGAIGLEATGQLKDTVLALHDTDIVQPGPSSPNIMGNTGEYCALEHLAVPYAYPVGPINSVSMLRTGAGRNNETWIHQANMLSEQARRMRDPRLIAFAETLKQFGWPLTGERTISGKISTPSGQVDLARALPFTTKMGIETFINYTLAGIDVTTQRRNVMQVANPNPKNEDRESPRDREFSIVNGVALFGGDLWQYIMESGKFPHQWNIEDIGKVNRLYGGYRHDFTVPSSGDHHPNKTVTVYNDYLMPSMTQLKQLDAVDFGRVEEVMFEAGKKVN